MIGRAIGLAATLAVAAAFALMMMSAWSLQSTCENEILGRAEGPQNGLSAVAFSRNCGATTGSNVQISVLPLGEMPAGVGNLLNMDRANYSDVAARWTDRNHLSLSIPQGARVFAKGTTVKAGSVSVDVSYNAVRPQ